MGAISHVFTLGHIVDLLKEDPEWLREICMEMSPEDGLIQIYGENGENTLGFTPYGIEILRGIIEERNQK